MLKAMAGQSVAKLRLDDPVDVSSLKIYFMEEAVHPLLNPVDPQIKGLIKMASEYLRTKCGARGAQSVTWDRLNHALYIGLATFSRAEGSVPMDVEMSQQKGQINWMTELVKGCVGLSDHTLPATSVAILEHFLPKPGSNWNDYYYAMGQELKSQLDEMLGDNGVLLFPTHPTPAPKHGTTITRAPNIGFTFIMNVMSLCSTHCPLGLNSEGLPIGCQVVASRYNDRLTIAVAEELEKGFGGWVSPSPAL
jgi:fatty acid amide hydrolase 2